MMAKRRAATDGESPAAGRNRIVFWLRFLADDYQRIAPTLDIVPLKLKDVLHKPGEPIAARLLSRRRLLLRW